MGRTKQGATYYRCDNCGSIFTLKNLPQDTNDPVNHSGEYFEQRLKRIKNLNKEPFVLDFGCGDGIFVRMLQEAKVRAVGYDKYTQPQVPDMQFDIVTMIEVIEHIKHFSKDIQLLWSLTKTGGYVYVESSFADWMSFKEIDNEEYIAPALGHQCILSHKGLITVMDVNGFSLSHQINRNCFVFRKR